MLPFSSFFPSINIIARAAEEAKHAQQTVREREKEEDRVFSRCFLCVLQRRSNQEYQQQHYTLKMPLLNKKVKLGICAMNKKSNSAQMQSILQRLSAFNEFEIIVFPDAVILNDPIESWPIVDALISFFSRGFPLEKAHMYVKLRKPFMVNDVTRQWTLLDRRLVYQTLMENNISVPNHVFVNRNDVSKLHDDEQLMEKLKRDPEAISGVKYAENVTSDEDGFDEKEDYVECKGKRIYKPFVEKPVDAENHNISIYYPHTVGGGHKELFRKVGNKSSTYYPPPTAQKRKKEGGNGAGVGGGSSAAGEESDGASNNRPVAELNDDARRLEEVEKMMMNMETISANEKGDASADASKTTSSQGQQEGEREEEKEEGNEEYVTYSRVRRSTSFIYEDFMSTNGTDVKVYTLGQDYAHAEARKSPVVDGRVLRDANGKEVRYPVLLSPEEKEIARRVCIAFGQNVCGFDLLRAKGKSYVCDVNGWSFVKDSKKFVEDAALCLRAMILKAVRPDHVNIKSAEQERESIITGRSSINEEYEDHEDGTVPSPSGGGSKNNNNSALASKPEELRAVLAVIRHGDRTPKQKMKLRVHQKPLLDLLAQCTKNNTRKQAKLKTPERLQELLNICRSIWGQVKKESEAILGDTENDLNLAAMQGNVEDPKKIEAKENLDGWRQVIAILEEGGHFSGINRKAQLKPISWVQTIDPRTGQSVEQVESALLILKFGGVLTHLGKNQAEVLGKDFRQRMYPRGSYYPTDSDGLLRLHSTYRHDLKIYSSDEGRVQITAAAFAKGLLALETHKGELTPILASLVTKDAKLLDFVTHEVEAEILHAKNKLYRMMTKGDPGDDEGNANTAANHGSIPSNDTAGDNTNVITHVNARLSRSGSDGMYESSGNTATPRAVRFGRASSRDDIHEENEYDELVTQTQGLFNIERSGNSWLIADRIAAVERGKLLDSHHFLTSVEGEYSHLEDVALASVPSSPSKKLRRVFELVHGISSQLLEMASRMNDKLKARNRWRKVLIALGKNRGLKDNALPPDTWVDTLTYFSATAPRGSAPASNTLELPGGGESFLLMHTRWKKLEEDLFHGRKETFDISKVPDVYDAAKYDSIHNAHLKLDGLEELYILSKELADCVVPNEYGTHPISKLRIGATIAGGLLGKLLADMSNTREESYAVETNKKKTVKLLGKKSLLNNRNSPDENNSTDPNDEDEDEEEDAPTRLNMRYATEKKVHSPYRHVRTRLYFTSESHLHSLLNILKYAHLEEDLRKRASGDKKRSSQHVAANSSPPKAATMTTQKTNSGGTSKTNAFGDPLLSPRKPPRAPNSSADVSFDARSDLDSDFTFTKRNPLVVEGLDEILGERSKELDYLTHIVFRMYECFHVPPDDPLRFRVEVMLSTGVCLDPFEKDVCESFRRSADALEKEGPVEPTPVLDRVQLQNDSVCEEDQPYLTLDTLEKYLNGFRRAKPEKKNKKENAEQHPLNGDIFP